jgi:transposase
MQNNIYNFYIGIDVSKNKLDIASSGPGGEFSVENSDEGIKELITRCAKEMNTSLVIMEATGGYEQLCLKMLSKLNFSVALANAKRVRDYAKSQGILAKSDRIDARIIRRFGMHSELKLYQMRDVKSEEKRELSGRREQLIKLIVTEKQRLEKAPKLTKKSIERVIKLLEKELDFIEQQLKKNIAADSESQEIIQRLISVPGIGETIATQLHVHLPELGKICNKSISALCGLAPFNHESGKYQGKRKISGGRYMVRKSLFMATLTAIRYNHRISYFYNKLVNAGKSKMVAIVACMRKLLVIINTMIKTEKAWQC